MSDDQYFLSIYDLCHDRNWIPSRGDEQMILCVVCGKPLKSDESKKNGFGPVCAKKIDKKAQKEIQAIVEMGLTCRILGDNIIQTEIPVEDPGQWPQTIDSNGKKWNYPTGKR